MKGGGEKRAELENREVERMETNTSSEWGGQHLVIGALRDLESFLRMA